MNISDQTIQNLSHLARLSFEPIEQDSIRHDLSNMVSFIEQLAQVDTNGVEPLLFMSDSTNVFREDIIAGSISQDAALAASPIPSKDYFKVPTVIKK